MSMDDLIQESCEKVILSWRKIMWTKPSTTHDSVHAGHTVVKIKGSSSGGCKLYILLCKGLDKKLTDWLVPMKAAYISEGVHTGKKKQVPELHLQASEVCSYFCFTSEDIQGSVEKIVFHQWLSVWLLWVGERVSFERICFAKRKIIGLKRKPLVGRWQASSSCNKWAFFQGCLILYAEWLIQTKLEHILNVQITMVK